MPAFVYLLRCADQTLYCGWTDDLARRVQVHNNGKGARYTRARLPVTLLWHEIVSDRSAALKRERAIKKLTRQQKLALAGSPLANGQRRRASRA
jgi:putative endonuclease